MRTINIGITQTKLELKRQQLVQIESQYKLLEDKINSVALRYDNKKVEIAKLEAVLVTAQTVTTA